MQLEIDILKATINVKKDPDIDQSTLTNGEKTVIIDVLKIDTHCYYYKNYNYQK